MVEMLCSDYFFPSCHYFRSNCFYALKFTSLDDMMISWRYGTHTNDLCAVCILIWIKFYNIITVAKIIPSRKAGHSAMIGICSRIMLGISDDPLLAGIKQHTQCVWLSFCEVLWESLHFFYCCLHGVLCQLTHSLST